jgi:hypothetical protein
VFLAFVATKAIRDDLVHLVYPAIKERMVNLDSPVIRVRRVNKAQQFPASRACPACRDRKDNLDYPVHLDCLARKGEWACREFAATKENPVFLASQVRLASPASKAKLD